MEKSFAVDLARKLNKALGMGSGKPMPMSASAISQMADDSRWLGSDFLDVNRVTGGNLVKFVPTGNVVTIAGQEASGKSLIGLNVLKNARDAGCFPVVLETEKALSYNGVVRSGLYSPDWDGLVLRTGYVETCLVALDRVIRESYNSGVRPVILLDSLGNLDIEKTLKDVLKGTLVLDQGTFQRSVKIMLKHLTGLCSMYDVPLIIITHIYMEPGMYGGKKIYGGQHLKFLSNTILFTSTTKKKNGVGYDLKLMSLKNRECPPFQEARVDIDIATSRVNRFAGLARVALDLGLFEKNGNYMYVPHIDKKLYESQIEGANADEVFSAEFLEELNDRIMSNGYNTISFDDELANDLHDSLDGTHVNKKDDDVEEKDDDVDVRALVDSIGNNEPEVLRVTEYFNTGDTIGNEETD